MTFQAIPRNPIEHLPIHHIRMKQWNRSISPVTSSFLEKRAQQKIKRREEKRKSLLNPVSIISIRSCQSLARNCMPNTGARHGNVERVKKRMKERDRERKKKEKKRARKHEIVREKEQKGKKNRGKEEKRKLTETDTKKTANKFQNEKRIRRKKHTHRRRIEIYYV